MAVDGYLVRAIETDIFGAALPGFVADFLLDGSLAFAPPFNNMEMVDVTNKLSLGSPLLLDTKVWMPIMDKF